MRLIGLVVSGALLASTGLAQLNVAKDPISTGQTSPEGVACDLARAFINRDSKQFLVITVKDGNDEYRKFLKNMSRAMAAEKKRKTPSRGGPKAIVTCYAARSLSLSGPKSAAYALFNFNDVKFVDVKVRLVNGETRLNRTLVIQDQDKRWYVHPRPDLVSTLSAGLNNEAPSSKEWKPLKG